MALSGPGRKLLRCEPVEARMRSVVVVVVTPHENAPAPQLAHHLTGTVKRILQKQLVDATHQRQVLLAFALRPVIERRTADRQNLALLAQTQFG